MAKRNGKTLHEQRMAELIAQAKAQVATGKCPKCGTTLRRNLALAGWWQCGAYGVEAMRHPDDKGKPACSWQTFTER